MSIVLQGSTSGSVTLQEPAIAGTTTINLPATSGTAVVGSSAVSAVGQIPFSTDGSTYTPTAKIVSGTVNGGAANPLSGGTAVDFTSIPSWVKRITVMIQGVSLSASGNLLIQLGDSGGIETTGYFSNGLYFDNSAATNSNAASTTGFLMLGATAAGVQYGVLTIVNITGNIWLASGTGATDDASTDYIGYISGTKTLSDVLTQVRISRTGAGTFDAGTINILYE